MLTAPSLFAVVVYSATLLAILSFGGRWAEGSYFILVHVWFAAWLGVSLYGIDRAWLAGKIRPAFAICALAVEIVYLLAILPGSDYSLAAYYRAPGKEQTEYMNLAETLNRTVTKGRPVIVDDSPYFYTVATGAQALCIPRSGDDYLLAYMNKYGAS